MLTKTSASRYKTVLNGTRTSLQIATGGGNEVTSVLVTGGSGGAVVRISDSASGKNLLDSFLVAANGGESTPFNPDSPILMKKGIFAELEQSSGNAEATIFYN